MSASNTKSVGKFVITSNYSEHSGSLVVLGIYVGKFISKLITELSVNSANINLVGHFFGSHVSGFAVKEVIRKTGHRVGRP